MVRGIESPVRRGPLMLYPELFKQLEAVRWNMDKDIPWEQIGRAHV